MLNQRLNFGPELASVPFLDQYWGVWAIEQTFGAGLARTLQNINLQVHLAEHAPESQAAAGSGSGRGPDLVIDSDGIAYIEISGTLMKHRASGMASTSTVETRRLVRAAVRSKDVRGILLLIDSPGGTVAGTTDLADDIRAAATQKPTFAYIQDLGASGAYWLASQATRVSANATGLVGSIGVFSVVEDSSKAAADAGVKVHVVRFGEMKGVATPGTEVTDEQLAYMQARIDSFGQDFVRAIAQGRQLSDARAAELADGRVHKGAEALKLGLIDAVETIDQALGALILETRRGKKMQTQANDNVATIAELEAACVGASSDFILSQAKAGATVSAALTAHAAVLAKSNAEHTDKITELTGKIVALEAQIAELEGKLAAKPVPRGASVIESGGDSGGVHAWSNVGAKAFFLDEVQQRKAKGYEHAKAAAATFAAYPGLRDALVTEAN